MKKFFWGGDYEFANLMYILTRSSTGIRSLLLHDVKIHVNLIILFCLSILFKSIFFWGNISCFCLKCSPRLFSKAEALQRQGSGVGDVLLVFTSSSLFDASTSHKNPKGPNPQRTESQKKTKTKNPKKGKDLFRLPKAHFSRAFS